jgi:hypothetical protein
MNSKNTTHNIQVQMSYGKSYQLPRRQFPLRLAYAMTYNKSQSQTLSKVLLNITLPPFSHGELCVALSNVGDCNIIRLCVAKDQLMQSNISLTGFMPTVDIMGPRGDSHSHNIDTPAELLMVRYGQVVAIAIILVPTSFLQVRESSRCSLCFFHMFLHGPTWELKENLLGLMHLDLVSIVLEV